MGKKAYIDISVFQCPKCSSYYAEASWYAVEIASDIECGKCGKTFNPVQYLADRSTVEFSLDNDGKVKTLKKVKKVQ